MRPETNCSLYDAPFDSKQGMKIVHTLGFSAFIIPDEFVNKDDGVLNTQSFMRQNMFWHYLWIKPHFSPFLNRVEKEIKGAWQLTSVINNYICMRECAINYKWLCYITNI